MSRSWLVVAALIGGGCTETVAPPMTPGPDTVRVTDTVRVVDTVAARRSVYRPVLVAEGLGGESGHLVAMTSDGAGFLVASQRGRVERLDGTLVFDLSPLLPDPPRRSAGSSTSSPTGASSTLSTPPGTPSPSSPASATRAGASGRSDEGGGQRAPRGPDVRRPHPCGLYARATNSGSFWKLRSAMRKT